MTPLSRCDLRLYTIRLMRPMTLIRFGMLLALVSGLALAQIHLRFRTRDLKIETRKLQKARIERNERKIILVAEVESLKCIDGVSRDWTKINLGLSDCPPERSDKATVSAESIARWKKLSLRESAAWRNHSPMPEESKVRLVAKVADRLLSWSTPLMARDVSDEEPRRQATP